MRKLLFLFILFISVWNLKGQVILVTSPCPVEIADTLYKSDCKPILLNCKCPVKEIDITITTLRGRNMIEITRVNNNNTFDWDYSKLHRGYYSYFITYTVDVKGKDQKRESSGTFMLIR